MIGLAFDDDAVHPLIALCASQPDVVAAWEFDELTARMALSISVVAFASLGSVVLYLHGGAAPTCDSELAKRSVYKALRDDFHLSGILLNNVGTVSGGFFSDSHDCSAEVAEIKGNVNMGDMPWREIRYRIVLHGKSPVVAVEMGGHVPFAPSAPSLCTRLLAYL